MKIWEFLPVDPADDCWAERAYKGRIVVRAPTEERAREILSLAIWLPADRLVGGGLVPTPPWNDPELVNYRELTDGSFDADGDEAILDPSEYDGDWSR